MEAYEDKGDQVRSAVGREGGESGIVQVYEQIL